MIHPCLRFATSHKHHYILYGCNKCNRASLLLLVFSFLPCSVSPLHPLSCSTFHLYRSFLTVSLSPSFCFLLIQSIASPLSLSALLAHYPLGLSVHASLRNDVIRFTCWDELAKIISTKKQQISYQTPRSTVKPKTIITLNEVMNRLEARTLMLPEYALERHTINCKWIFSKDWTFVSSIISFILLLHLICCFWLMR